jgi:hypothetical protein
MSTQFEGKKTVGWAERLWSVRRKWLIPAIVVVVAMVGLNIFGEHSNSANDKIDAAHAMIAAEPACAPRIERLAKNDFQWTNGWLEPIFDTLHRSTTNGDVTTYSGGKIKFQNGFGAWTYYTYECDFNTANKSVIDVRATPGRL